MNNIDKIKELELIIQQTKKKIDDLDKTYRKGFAPKGYGKGTSYNDFDTIKGGNKELHMEDYFAEKKRLETLLELTEDILLSLKREVDEKEYLELLSNNYQKIKFLRIVKGYTQAKTAEMLNISIRYVQKIEKKLK